MKIFNWLKGLISRGARAMSEALNDGLTAGAVGQAEAEQALGGVARIPVLDAVPSADGSVKPIGATDAYTGPVISGPSALTADVADFDAVADKIKATFEKLGIEVHDAWAEVVAVAKKV